MYKRDTNLNTLYCAINDNLRHELEQLHERRPNDKTMSHTVRFLLWYGLKHYKLYSNLKADRVQGAEMDIDQLTASEQEQLQSESGIYISKL